MWRSKKLLHEEIYVYIVCECVCLWVSYMCTHCGRLKVKSKILNRTEKQTLLELVEGMELLEIEMEYKHIYTHIYVIYSIFLYLVKYVTISLGSSLLTYFFISAPLKDHLSIIPILTSLWSRPTRKALARIHLLLLNYSITEGSPTVAASGTEFFHFVFTFVLSSFESYF